jgi:hypothetical protein
MLELYQTMAKLELSCSLVESELALQEIFKMLCDIRSSSSLQFDRQTIGEIIQRTWLVLETVAAIKKQVDLELDSTIEDDTLASPDPANFSQLALKGLEQKWALIKDSCALYTRTWVENVEFQASDDSLMAMVSAQYRTLTLIQEFWRLYEDVLSHH